MRLFAVLLFATSLFGQDTYGPMPDVVELNKPVDSFQKTLGKATQALYLGKQICDYKKEETFFGPLLFWVCEFKNKFVCTATIIDGQDGDYIALTAGHCINWKYEHDYYISDTVEDEPVLRHVTVVKSDNTNRYDYAILRFQSIKEYPTIELNKQDSDLPVVGTFVLNVNFAEGVGKEYLDGKVVSEKLYGDGLRNRYLVTIGVGPGASGSAVVDSESHRIVGLAEMIFPSTQMSTVVIPTGQNLANFMDDDSAGLKPQPEDKSKLPKEGGPPEEEKKPSLFARLWVLIKGLLHIG